jgi:hypothetical protein
MCRVTSGEMTVAALALMAALAGGLAARAEKPAEGPKRLLQALESYRTKMPPAEGLGEQNGIVITGMEPFTESHLAGVARRLGAKSQADCLALMTYVKDRDLKIRFIAIQAINGVIKAYPHGMSVECVLDTASDGHRKMVLRFVELIQKLGG